MKASFKCFITPRGGDVSIFISTFCFHLAFSLPAKRWSNSFWCWWQWRRGAVLWSVVLVGPQQVWPTVLVHHPWRQAGVLGFSSAHRRRQFKLFRIFHHPGNSRWEWWNLRNFGNSCISGPELCQEGHLTQLTQFPLLSGISLYIYLKHLWFSHEKILKVCLGTPSTHGNLWTQGLPFTLSLAIWPCCPIGCMC